MTQDQVDELRERSKDDRAFIAGSEVRMLCGEIDRLRAELQKCRDDVLEEAARMAEETPFVSGKDAASEIRTLKRGGQ